MKGQAQLIHNAPPEHAGLGPLPVRVRTRTGEIVGSGITGQPITVPPGSYYVTLLLPDGSEIGADKKVRAVMGGAVPTPESPSPAAMIARAPTQVEDVTTCAASIWRGDWLAGWATAMPVVTSGAASITLSTAEPTVIAQEDGADRLLVIPLADRVRCTIIPYDECPVCIDDSATARAIAARLGAGFTVDYRSIVSEETNGLLGYVEGGVLNNMVAVTEDEVRQGKQALAGAGVSVLRAITGSYVLLRANALDGLENWLDRLQPVGANLPDLLPLRAEFYARLGDHARAVEIIRSGITSRRCPWFRAGLSYMQERVRLYIDVTENKSAAFALSDDDLALFKAARDALERMLPAMLTSRYIATFDLPLGQG